MKAEICEKVREKPGIHFRCLQRETECSSSTLNYHLEDMELRERRIHGYRRFYPPEVPESFEKSLAALNHDVRGLMLYRIKDGTTQKELVEELDRSKSTVSVHLKTLREDGLIREESEGHSKKIYLQKDALSAVERYASDLVDKVSDGFIEMWD